MKDDLHWTARRSSVRADKAIRYNYSLLFFSFSVSDQEGGVCHAAVCEKEAKNIKKNMDLMTDPCRDFDQFACGGWRQRYPIPKSSSEISVFSQLWNDEEKVLKDLIEKQVDNSGIQVVCKS